VTQARVIHSEWIKLWSLRSTRWTLAVAVISMVFGIVIAAIDMSRWSTISAHDKATFSAIDTSLAGYHFAQLAIGVLGVLVVTGEYTTGMIRSSFMAVPKRLPVFWAKLLVFASVTFVLMLVSAFLAFFISQAVLTHEHVQVTIGHPHALRAVVGDALFLTALAIFCVSLGALIRNTAGGIAAFAGVMFALPGINGILPTSLHNAINPYLPSNAGAAILTDRPSSHWPSPWGGFGIFCAYTAITLVAAVILLKRRDT
jgi:ABC-type transport system involved in multi-copper enzyme maturation permease subunit